jgi:hypothetical protein
MIERVDAGIGRNGSKFPDPGIDRLSMALDIGVVAELAVLERHPLADRGEPAELCIAESRTRMDEGLAVA